MPLPSRNIPSAEDSPTHEAEIANPASSSLTPSFFAKLVGTHDVALGPWGPFSKRHVGISHIPDPAGGIRADFFYAGGFHRRTVTLPHALRESAWHPWCASTDLSRYRLRHQILWKDLVYVDVDYCRLDGHRVLVATRLVNNTDLRRSLCSHLILNIAFPPLREYSNEAVQTVVPSKNAHWTAALDYLSLEMGAQRHRSGLVTDGHRRGESRTHGSVDGSVLGGGFGNHRDDQVSYRTFGEGVTWMRWRLPTGRRIEMEIIGPPNLRLALRGTGQFELTRLPGPIDAGPVTLRIVEPSEGFELDGFVTQPSGSPPCFEPNENNPVPKVSRFAHGVSATYDAIEGAYGISWSPQRETVLREFISEQFDEFFGRMTHEHTSALLKETPDARDHHLDVFVRPIPLAARSSRTEFYLLCQGDPDFVRREVEQFDASEPRWADLVDSTQPRPVGGHPEGARYRNSQERMAAVTLTNVVYPVRTRGTWIRHYCPGRWWDCLYTWDSGFIGMGMLEQDVPRAIEILNAYLTEPGTPDAAFIHHGTPLPVQHYLAQELWHRTRSQELAEYCYPRLAQYHRFLAGRVPGSTTRMAGSGLLRTFDYFYNSGGWDDYPAQATVHRRKLSHRVAPVVNTAHAIRTARILRQFARILGESHQEWDRDIVEFQTALDQYAWDGESGYYGYVEHDEDAKPIGILRDQNGVNENMGLDGVSPLIGGLRDAVREACLVEKLRTPGRLWTPYGLSAVDCSAPYFQSGGYWNGAVWMPHQWFFWKSLLDIGDAEWAWRIASTALDLWQRETDDSHCCFEHFLAETGQGAGWHHFSGLSTPVLSWYGAYFRGPRLTTGFNILPYRVVWRGDGRRLEAELESESTPWQAPVVLVAMPDDHRSTSVRAAWNGQPLESRHRTGACHEVTLPCGEQRGILTVEG